MSTTAVESPQLRAFREAVERFVAAFNDGDFERASTGFAEDVEQQFPPTFPERHVRGRAAWCEFFREMRRDMETWRMTPRDFVEAAPDRFIAEIDYDGVGRSSGVETKIRVWNLVELDDRGRVRRIRDFVDRDEAIAAAAEAS